MCVVVCIVNILISVKYIRRMHPSNFYQPNHTETDDYAAGPYPVMFAPGETEVQVKIPLMDDDVDECDEEFFGQLSIPEEAAAMGVKLGDAATATVTIDDNDSKSVHCCIKFVDIASIEASTDDTYV